MRLAPSDPRLYFCAPRPIDRTQGDVRMERFPPAVTKLLTGQIGPLANLRSSTGCSVRVITDSPWVILHLNRLRHHQPIPQGVALEVKQRDGSWLTVDSSDLRELDGAVPVRLPTGLRAGELRECVLWMPLLSTAVITGVSLADDAQVESVPEETPAWLAIGDSLTQGFSTQSPVTTWVHRLMRHWNLPAWNLGVGGILIEPEAFRWALEAQRWPLVTIALGSNNGWRESTVSSAADNAALLVDIALANADQVVWCLPPWKPMEDGKGPTEFMGIPLDRDTGSRIARVREALRARLAQYPSVVVLEDLMPHDHRWYPDGLHPFAWGFARFAEGLAARFQPATATVRCA